MSSRLRTGDWRLETEISDNKERGRGTEEPHSRRTRQGIFLPNLTQTSWLLCGTRTLSSTVKLRKLKLRSHDGPAQGCRPQGGARVPPGVTGRTAHGCSAPGHGTWWGGQAVLGSQRLGCGLSFSSDFLCDLGPKAPHSESECPHP